METNNKKPNRQVPLFPFVFLIFNNKVRQFCVLKNISLKLKKKLSKLVCKIDVRKMFLNYFPKNEKKAEEFAKNIRTVFLMINEILMFLGYTSTLFPTLERSSGIFRVVKQ